MSDKRYFKNIYIDGCDALNEMDADIIIEQNTKGNYKMTIIIDELSQLPYDFRDEDHPVIHGIEHC